MHTHTIRTKFTFGDRVRFNSLLNGSGVGTVFAICFDESGGVDYLIQLDGRDDMQGGIADDEMTLITDAFDTPHIID